MNNLLFITLGLKSVMYVTCFIVLTPREVADANHFRFIKEEVIFFAVHRCGTCMKQVLSNIIAAIKK